METRYDTCKNCLALQEELLISTDYACGQILCTCEPDNSVDFNLDSAWTTNNIYEEKESSSTQIVVDLRTTTPKKKQTPANSHGIVIPSEEEDKGRKVSVNRRNTKPCILAAETEAPCGTMVHVICTGAEFNLLKYEDGEVIITATHRGKCNDKIAGYHTHYRIGLHESDEPGWSVA